MAWGINKNSFAGAAPIDPHTTSPVSTPSSMSTTFSPPPPAPVQSATGAPGAPQGYDPGGYNYDFGSGTSTGGMGPAPAGALPPGMTRQVSDIRATPYQPPTPTPTNPDNNLLVAGDQEKFYGDTSQEYKDPSYTEKLVAQGMGGQLNDYYEFANNKLNDQFAAMGGGPSGALLRASQGMRAQQAHDMMDFTRSADDVHYGRLGAGQRAAASSDSGRGDRLRNVFGSAVGLGSSEARAAEGFYGNAAANSNPFTSEAINTGVQNSTINPAVNAYKDTISGVKAYYGAGG